VRAAVVIVPLATAFSSASLPANAAREIDFERQ
jgi:hypothetical protein